MPLDTEPTEEQIAQATADVAGANTLDSSVWSSAATQVAANEAPRQSSQQAEWERVKVGFESKDNWPLHPNSLGSLPPVQDPMDGEGDVQFVLHQNNKPLCKVVHSKKYLEGNITKKLASYKLYDRMLISRFHAIVDNYIKIQPEIYKRQVRAFGVPIKQWEVAKVVNLRIGQIRLQDKDKHGKIAAIRGGLYVYMICLFEKNGGCEFATDQVYGARRGVLSNNNFVVDNLFDPIQIPPALAMSKVNQDFLKIKVPPIPGDPDPLIDKGKFVFNSVVIFPHMASGLSWNVNGKTPTGKPVLK